MTVPRLCFFCGSFFSLFMFHDCLYYIVLSVQCSLVVNCWERADLLALLCVMFPCDFVTFPYGVLGQVWFLIVSISDICLLPYFYKNMRQCLATYVNKRHFSIISSIIVFTFLEDRKTFACRQLSGTSAFASEYQYGIYLIAEVTNVRNTCHCIRLQLMPA